MLILWGPFQIVYGRLDAFLYPNIHIPKVLLDVLLGIPCQLTLHHFSGFGKSYPLLEVIKLALCFEFLDIGLIGGLNSLDHHHLNKVSVKLHPF